MEEGVFVENNGTTAEWNPDVFGGTVVHGDHLGSFKFLLTIKENFVI